MRSKKALRIVTLMLLLAMILGVLASCGEEIRNPVHTEAPTETPTEAPTETPTGTPHIHAFGEWQITTEADCENAGEKTRSCACGETETEPISALGHTWADGKCTRCQLDHKHDFETSVTVEPTCGKEGVAKSICKICGYKKIEPLPASEHVPGDWTVKTAPTCQEPGKEVSTCSICKQEIERSVSTVAHNFASGKCTFCHLLEKSLYSGNADTTWYDASKTEFVLESADQLMGFQNLRGEDISFEGKTIKLNIDVILNEGTAEELRNATNPQKWREINSAYFFKGTFDGQGHKIQGLVLKCTKNAVRGMFGGVGGNAVIKNLTIENAYFQGPTAEKKSTLGILIAKIAEKGCNVTISDVHISGIVESGSAPFKTIGGFVGQIGAEEARVTFRNCSFDGIVSVNGDCAGGMIGEITGANTQVFLEGCRVNAAISAESSIGRFAGYAPIERLICDDKTVFTGTLNGSAPEDTPIYDGKEDLAPLAEAPEGTQSLRAMSFNIQANAPNTLAGNNRRAAIIQEILNNNPTVLGVQEDSGTWDAYLSEHLPGYNAFYSNSVTGSERNAIFCKKDVHVLETGTHWLTSSGESWQVALSMSDLNDPNSPFYMTDAEMEMLFLHRSDPDSALYSTKNTYIDKNTGEQKTGNVGAYLSHRNMNYVVMEFHGRPILYVNTHLTHRGPNNPWYNTAYAKLRSNERIQEFNILQRHVEEICAKYENILVYITGDMNDLEGEPIYTHATSMYLDACKYAAVTRGIVGTWNNAFDLSKQGDNYPNRKENTGTNKLDYCFISKKGFTVLRYKAGAGKATITLEDGTQKTLYTSDHLPIIIDLNFTVPDLISVPAAPESKIYTINDFTPALPERFTGDGVIHIPASVVEENSDVQAKTENKQYCLYAKEGVADDVSSAGGVTKLITSGIYHYYLDSAVTADHRYFRIAVEVPEDGLYEMALFLRLKETKTGTSAARSHDLKIDDFNPIRLAYKELSSVSSVKDGTTDGSYLSGWSVNLTRGKHVFTFTMPETTSFHFRDFYFLRIGDFKCVDSPVWNTQPEEQIVETAWHCGYVASDQHKTNPNKLVQNGNLYSYSDIIHLEKAGTTITFTVKNTKFASTSAYVISRWKEENGKWVLDTDAIHYPGSGSSDSDIATHLSSGDGVTYSYTSTFDHEYIRLTYRSEEKAGYTPAERPSVTMAYTGKPGTAAALLTLDDWIEGTKAEYYEPALKGLTINAIGDSYFAGNGLQKEFVWLNLLAKKYEITLNNYGVNGSTVSDFNTSHNPMCLRFTSMPNNNPDIVLIEGGRNDYSYDTPIGSVDSRDTKTYMGALNVMIDGFQEKYPNALIICVTCWNFPNNRNKTLLSSDYASAMIQVAAARGVKVINASNPTISGVDMTGEAFRSTYCMKPTDVSHLNLDGMKLVMPRFEKLIAQYYIASKTI